MPLISDKRQILKEINKGKTIVYLTKSNVSRQDKLWNYLGALL
ncbi:MAG: hypothetical protein JWR87_1736 [Segetibacter sp.]|jgi:hypothetical protein|nr:hypothetical protein [Segetibacter sp.]